MENINETEKGTQTENVGNESEAQGTGKKTFTQDEVNAFVQNRIARLRSQIEKESKATYDQKLAELNQREMRLLTRERLETRGMDKALADVITCTDEKDLEDKLDKLEHIYGSSAASKEKDMPKGFQIGGGIESNGTPPDSIRKAMGLN